MKIIVLLAMSLAYIHVTLCYTAGGLIQDKRHQQLQDEPVPSDHVHLLYMNLKLDDIANTLKDIQQPCMEKADGGIDKKIHRLEETIEQMANDISKIKTKQTEMEEEIFENRKHSNTKYQELNADANEIKERLNENRQYTITKIHEVKVEANDNVDATNTKHRELKQSVEELKQGIGRNVKTSGATYVRWGRTTCPGNGSDLVYSGYAGGSHYTHKGAAVSMLCLPTDPDWELHTANEDMNTAFIYGTEYRSGKGRLDEIFGTGHQDQDVPCAVCNIRSRSSVIMIPAKTKCHPGWTLEFTGYLMAGYHNHEAATDYYCIDKEPENVVGGRESLNDNGYLLFFVEARCGSLKCPPYVNGRELTCVVCSK